MFGRARGVPDGNLLYVESSEGIACLFARALSWQGSWMLRPQRAAPVPAPAHVGSTHLAHPCTIEDVGLLEAAGRRLREQTWLVYICHSDQDYLILTFHESRQRLLELTNQTMHDWRLLDPPCASLDVDLKQRRHDILGNFGALMFS